MQLRSSDVLHIMDLPPLIIPNITLRMLPQMLMFRNDAEMRLIKNSFLVVDFQMNIVRAERFGILMEELVDTLNRIMPKWMHEDFDDVLEKLNNKLIYLDVFKVHDEKRMIITKLSSRHRNDIYIEYIKDSKLTNKQIAKSYEIALLRDKGRVGCPVCLEDVTSDSLKPLIVTNQCYHLLCLDCYYRYVNNSENQKPENEVIKLGYMPACPCCRTQTTISFDINICSRLMRHHI